MGLLRHKLRSPYRTAGPIYAREARPITFLGFRMLIPTPWQCKRHHLPSGRAVSCHWRVGCSPGALPRKHCRWRWQGGASAR